MKTTKLSFFLPLSYLLLTSLTLLAVLSANAQVPSYVPTNGLVGYWPFNGNANDESGNGNNGSNAIGNYTTDRNEVVNSSFYGNGNGSGINISAMNNFPFGNSTRSISVWFKLDVPYNGGGTLFTYGDNTFGTRFSATIIGSEIGVEYMNGTVLASFVVDNLWHNLVITYDGFGSSGILLFLDGSLMPNITFLNPTTELNTADSFIHNIGNLNGIYNFAGKYDDIGIWNRALTADEVLALYNGCNLTPQVVVGNATPGAFANSTYTCNNNAGSTFAWTVNNGVVVSGQGTNSVTILWGAEGVGSVSVAETTADGCVGDEVIYDVNVQCVVSGNEITGPVGPEAFSNSTYTCNSNAGSTYNWTVTNGVIVSGQGTNSVTILWGAEGVGSVSVAETTADGCVGDEVVYDVNVQCVVSGNEITGSVGPEAFSNSTYTCNGAANSTYNWTVTNGVIASGQGTNTVNILWASTGLGNVSVVETTTEGCVGTTLSQDVVVIPTNVEELSNAMILYPNPATTELNLQITSDLIGTNLFVFDALGKQILKQQILSTNTRINTSAFSAGNYMVKIGGLVKRFEVKK